MVMEYLIDEVTGEQRDLKEMREQALRLSGDTALQAKETASIGLR